MYYVGMGRDATCVVHWFKNGIVDVCVLNLGSHDIATG